MNKPLTASFHGSKTDVDICLNHRKIVFVDFRELLYCFIHANFWANLDLSQAYSLDTETKKGYCMPANQWSRLDQNLA